MLAGRAPFAGETVTDILAAVVTREPELGGAAGGHTGVSARDRALSRQGSERRVCATSAMPGWIWRRGRGRRAKSSHRLDNTGAVGLARVAVGIASAARSGGRMGVLGPGLAPAQPTCR